MSGVILGMVDGDFVDDNEEWKGVGCFLSL